MTINELKEGTHQTLPMARLVNGETRRMRTFPWPESSGDDAVDLTPMMRASNNGSASVCATSDKAQNKVLRQVLARVARHTC